MGSKYTVDNSGIITSNANELHLGDDTAATNKEILFEIGSVNEPRLRYDFATSKIQLSNDGTTFSDISTSSTPSGGWTDDGVYVRLSTITDSVGIGTATPTEKLEVVSGSIKTDTQLISTVSTGTSPLSVASTTLVTNLNSDLLDGQSGSFYQSASNINAGTLAIARGGTNATSFTTGSVLFFDGTSITQDNTNLFFDDSANTLKVGVAVLSPSFQALTGSGNSTQLTANAGGSTGGSVTVAAGNGTVDGGSISVLAGSGTGNNGGSVTIAGSTGNAAGGNVSISAGNAAAAGTGGSLTLKAGDVPSGTEGDIILNVNGAIAARFNGSGNFVPETNNTGKLGTSLLKWNEVNATTVNAGDLKFANGWYLTEGDKVGLGDEMIMCSPSGKMYRFNLVEVK